MRALHRHARRVAPSARSCCPILQLEATLARKLGRRLTQGDRAARRGPRARRPDAAHRRAARQDRDDAAGAAADRRRRVRRRAPGRATRLMRRLPVDELRRLARKLEARGRRAGGRRHDAAPRGGVALGRRRARRAARRRGSTARSEAAGSVYLPERLHLVRIAREEAALRGRARRTKSAGAARRADAAGAQAQPGTARPAPRPAGAASSGCARCRRRSTPPDLAAGASSTRSSRRSRTSCRRLHARYMRAARRRSPTSAVALRRQPRARPPRAARGGGIADGQRPTSCI